MKNEWIVIAVILVFVIALVIYLMKRNQKDKKDYIRFLNETKINEELNQKEEEKNTM